VEKEQHQQQQWFDRRPIPQGWTAHLRRANLDTLVVFFRNENQLVL
jgi:hypothetical protein